MYCHATFSALYQFAHQLGSITVDAPHKTTAPSADFQKASYCFSFHQFHAQKGIIHIANCGRRTLSSTPSQCPFIAMRKTNRSTCPCAKSNATGKNKTAFRNSQRLPARARNSNFMPDHRIYAIENGNKAKGTNKRANGCGEKKPPMVYGDWLSTIAFAACQKILKSNPSKPFSPYGVRAHRKPTLLRVSSAPAHLRLNVCREIYALCHEPPRITR